MTKDFQDVQASFGRCALNPDFLDAFYKKLMTTSPEVAMLFRNTDFKRQKKVLQMSINMLITHAMGTGIMVDYLQQVGEIHSRRGLNIAPHHYLTWLNSLMQTVKECDPKYTPQLEQAWRACLNPGIELIKSKY